MKSKSQVGASAPNDGLCKTSPEEASRFLAWVSAVSAIVWAVTVAGFVGYGMSIASSGVLQLMLLVTILHVGQAFASAVSLKLGALFAALAFLIGAVAFAGNPSEIAALTYALICPGCALILMRRYTLADRHENAG